VVARNKALVLGWLELKPLKEVLGGYFTSVAGAVACMDKQIALWEYPESEVSAVGV
jgi:hypothetical protein